MNYQVVVTTNIPAQRVQDMVVSAFEGGSNYWIGNGRVELVTPTYDELGGRGVIWYGRQTDNVFDRENFKITIDVPDDKLRVLDRAAVANGLSLMAAHHKEHFSDLLLENDDAATADVFLQLCLFEEIVYG